MHTYDQCEEMVNRFTPVIKPTTLKDIFDFFQSVIIPGGGLSFGGIYYGELKSYKGWKREVIYIYEDYFCYSETEPKFIRRKADYLKHRHMLTNEKEVFYLFVDSINVNNIFQDNIKETKEELYKEFVNKFRNE